MRRPLLEVEAGAMDRWPSYGRRTSPNRRYAIDVVDLGRVGSRAASGETWRAAVAAARLGGEMAEGASRCGMTAPRVIVIAEKRSNQPCERERERERREDVMDDRVWGLRVIPRDRTSQNGGAAEVAHMSRRTSPLDLGRLSCSSYRCCCCYCCR